MKYKLAATSPVKQMNIRALKDYGTFGGPNMWKIQYQREDGWWIDIQWMSRGNAEEVVGPLPEFKIFRGKVVPVK